MKLKYFIKGDKKYIIESATENGLIVHLENEIGEPASSPLTATYSDLMHKLENESIKFNPETPLAEFKIIIKQLERDAKAERIEREELELKKKQHEDKVRKEKELKDIEDRRRKAKLEKIKLELEDDEEN